jgi:hypothetical protein
MGAARARAPNTLPFTDTLAGMRWPTSSVAQSGYAVYPVFRGLDRPAFACYLGGTMRRCVSLWFLAIAAAFAAVGSAEQGTLAPDGHDSISEAAYAFPGPLARLTRAGEARSRVVAAPAPVVLASDAATLRPDHGRALQEVASGSLPSGQGLRSGQPSRGPPAG